MKQIQLLQNSHTINEYNEVIDCLKSVYDPELDESIIDLDFVSKIEVNSYGLVNIELRLPTYFCSANFAWIMCYDAKKAIENLPWVKTAHVELVDHFVMKKVNIGLENNQSFADIFGTKKELDLNQLRRKFEEKAFLNRQSMLIQFLREKKISDSQILSITFKEITSLARKFQDSHFNKNLERYRDLHKRVLPLNTDQFAFLGLDGRKIKENNICDYLRILRRTTGSITANSEMCKILMKERYTAGGQVK